MPSSLNLTARGRNAVYHLVALSSMIGQPGPRYGLRDAVIMFNDLARDTLILRPAAAASNRRAAVCR